MILTTLPESAIYTKYGADAFPEDADKASCDGQQFAKCWVTGKWELVTPENPIIKIKSWCGDFMLISYDSTVGNAKRLAERWNADPDTHPNQIITHLVDINGNVHQISDRQFTLF